MAGLLTVDGEILIGNLSLKGGDANRGTSLQLGLFTNSAVPTSAITLSSITEPTGGSYARKTLTDASWTQIGSVFSYTIQTFLATGSAFTGNIYGYFIATTGTVPKLLWIERDTNVLVPYTIIQDDSYDVTPIITIV